MEHKMINLLIELLRKSGSEILVKDLLRETDRDAHDRHWTVEEIESACAYLENVNKFFTRADVVFIIENLIKKNNLSYLNFDKVDG